MLSRLSAFCLRLFGWKTSGVLPDGIEKAVLIVAPHTSYWDFIVGRLTFWAGKVKIRLLIKKEVFVFPLGTILKMAGGVPVARGKKNDMVDQVVDLFGKYRSLVVVITPEGTRRKVRKWKKGFYLIALKARVPIALAYIDYGKKIGGIGPILYPTGDYEKDMDFIYRFYSDKTGRHPERFQIPRPGHSNETSNSSI